MRVTTTGRVLAVGMPWARALRPHIDNYQESAFDQRKIFVVNSRPRILLRRAMPNWPSSSSAVA